jgi:hypothetical protein
MTELKDTFNSGGNDGNLLWTELRAVIGMVTKAAFLSESLSRAGAVGRGLDWNRGKIIFSFKFLTIIINV